MTERLVTIAKYHFVGEAQMAKLTLAAKGIDCFLADEFMSTYLPIAMGGIRLQVKESDVEQAKEILQDLESVTDVKDDENAGCGEE